MELVKNRVPSSMQLINAVVVGKGEFITTSVPSWELTINPTQSVKWLVSISEIVDQESKGVWLSSLLIILSVVHNSLVDERVLVTRGALEPVNYAWNSCTDVLLIELKIRVVIDVITLIKVRDINKMPVWLPATALVLDHVSEGSRLNERMIALAICDSFVCHDSQDIFSLLKSVWSFLLKDIICHSCNYNTR